MMTTAATPIILTLFFPMAGRMPSDLKRFRSSTASIHAEDVHYRQVRERHAEDGGDRRQRSQDARAPCGRRPPGGTPMSS